MLIHGMKEKNGKKLTYEFKKLGINCSLGSNNRLGILTHEHFYGFFIVC